MACRPDADGVLFVVLDKRQRLGHWMLNRDEDLIAQLMTRADEIGDLLDAHKLPDDAIIREDHVKAMYPTPKGSIELPRVAITLIGQWMSAKQAKEDAESMEQDARDALTALLGDAEIGTVDGHQIVSFKSRSTGARWDTKRLEQERPDLATEYKKQAGTTRVLKALGE
jgi:predicted phage-related endonuclease